MKKTYQKTKLVGEREFFGFATIRLSGGIICSRKANYRIFS